MKVRICILHHLSTTTVLYLPVYILYADRAEMRDRWTIARTAAGGVMKCYLATYCCIIISALTTAAVVVERAKNTDTFGHLTDAGRRGRQHPHGRDSDLHCKQYILIMHMVRLRRFLYYTQDDETRRSYRRSTVFGQSTRPKSHRMLHSPQLGDGSE